MRMEAKKSLHSLYILANESFKILLEFHHEDAKTPCYKKQRPKLQGSLNISPLNDPKQ